VSEYDEKMQREMDDAKEKHKNQLDEVNQETKQLKDALETLENKVRGKKSKHVSSFGRF